MSPLILNKSVGSPSVVDWDRDGDNDIVVRHFNHFYLSKTVAAQLLTQDQEPTDRVNSSSWEFEKLQLDIEREGASITCHDFGDYDGDGSFDLVYSVLGAKHVIYFVRNLAESGTPRFDQPLKIFEAPDLWRIDSLAIADVDQDGRSEVVCGVNKPLLGDEKPNWIIDSQVWLLDR